jgi:hypothetical protein
LKGFFLVYLTVLIMGWIASQARAAKARHVGQDWIFPPAKGLEMAYVLAIVIGASVIFLGFRGREGERAITGSMGLLIIAFSVITWPKAIRLSETGLRQRSWCNGWKSIDWSDVSDIREKQDGSVVIHGKQCNVVFSQFHADRDSFLEKVRRLAR